MATALTVCDLENPGEILKNLYNSQELPDIGFVVSKTRPRAVRTFRVPILTTKTR